MEPGSRAGRTRVASVDAPKDASDLIDAAAMRTICLGAGTAEELPPNTCAEISGGHADRKPRSPKGSRVADQAARCLTRYKPVAQQLSHFAEKDKEAEALQTKQDRLKRLGGRRKHVEKQVQDNMAALDDLEEKLKKQRECLGETHERLTTLKQEFAEALTHLNTAGMQES